MRVGFDRDSRNLASVQPEYHTVRCTHSIKIDGIFTNSGFWKPPIRCLNAFPGIARPIFAKLSKCLGVQLKSALTLAAYLEVEWGIPRPAQCVCGAATDFSAFEQVSL
jgi:hypothetical protein